MSRPNPYTETEESLVTTCRRIHGNSEQTHVAIVTAGSDYAAVAYDLDPVEFEPVAAEIVAYDPTIEGAAERAERWMETHPKGIAADEGGGSFGSRFLNGLVNLGRKLDDYGNREVEEIREGDH